MADDSPVTESPHAWSEGDPQALEELMALVYTELREMSRRVLRRERHLQTLSPTVVVHEVYLRLVRLKKVSWENRRPFFAYAAKLMRYVVVDHARAVKRMELDRASNERVEVELDQLPGKQKSVDVLQLEDVLQDLQKSDPLLVKIIELRFFAGLNEVETAEALGLNRTRVQREWRIARRLLAERLQGREHERP